MVNKTWHLVEQHGCWWAFYWHSPCTILSVVLRQGTALAMAIDDERMDQAEELVRLAGLTEDLTVRDQLIDFARGWMAAEQRDRRSDDDHCAHDAVDSPGRSRVRLDLQRRSQAAGVPGSAGGSQPALKRPSCPTRTHGAVALVHRSGHPFASHVEKLVSNFLISCQASKPHAFARVVHVFLVGDHAALPLQAATGLSAPSAWA
jgi:hypothetical protein